MITVFERLFGLGVTHAFYDGSCRDFAFTIPADTARLLARGRLIARAIDDELVVAYETNGTGTEPRVDLTGERLRFGLQLTNPYFPHFTVLPVLPAGAVRVYQNAGITSVLAAPEALMLTPAVFSFPITRATRPVTATVIRDGVTLRTDALPDARPNATFDLRGLEPGRFVVQERFAGGGSQSTDCYLDPESQQSGVFAIVEIKITPGFYTSAPALRIDFAAKQETLKYYVVVSNYSNPDFAALTVEDGGFTEDARTEIEFDRIAAADFDEDAEIPVEVLTASGGRVVLFKSKAVVPRRLAGSRKLQLKKNTDTLIEHLPQPGSANATSDLVVHLFKPKRA